MQDKRHKIIQFRNVSDSVGQSCWQPSADVYRGSKGWLVKFDLAGVRPQDITLVVDGRRLTMKGIRRDFSVLEQQTAFSMEIAYNQFERTIDLPVDIENARLTHDYHDGMYLIVIHQ